MTVDDEIELCKRATEEGILILFRNDDESSIVTNATTAETIKALGEALSCGYGCEKAI